MIDGTRLLPSMASVFACLSALGSTPWARLDRAIGSFYTIVFFSSFSYHCGLATVSVKESRAPFFLAGLIRVDGEDACPSPRGMISSLPFLSSFVWRMLFLSPIKFDLLGGFGGPHAV